MVVVGFCLVWGDWQTNRRRPVWDGLSMAGACAVSCGVGAWRLIKVAKKGAPFGAPARGVGWGPQFMREWMGAGMWPPWRTKASWPSGQRGATTVPPPKRPPKSK